MAEFRKKMDDFVANCDPRWTPLQIRNAFIRTYAGCPNRPIASIPGEWVSCPIQTMYEPQKRVGIVHSRRMTTAEKQNDHWCELVANSSLHAVGSYFNVLRQRVSYLHRPGKSRSSSTWCNAFQAYRPGMIQKAVDIARVYFNWVEPRPFRISRRFNPLAPTIFDSGHETIETADKEQTRSAWRQNKSTPAIRLRLAKSPVRLDTILYDKWPEKLLAPAKALKKRPPSSRGDRPPRGGIELDHSIPF